MYRAWMAMLILALAILSLVPMPEQDVTVVLDAASYAQLTEPMRMVKAAEAGQEGAVSSYVELPAGCGQGWRGKGSGSVVYRLDLPLDGSYRVWGRALWGDGCTNAFFLRNNDGQNVVFGNDAVFNQWHWVKSPLLQFKKGINYLTVSNHSDGTALSKLIVTNNPLYAPEGLGEDITYFLDGFAGCDADNSGSWTFKVGTWRVIHSPDNEAGAVNDCLGQWASGEMAIAYTGYDAWHDYSGRVKVRFTAPGALSFVFHHTQSEEESRLTLQVDDPRGRLRLVRATAGHENTLLDHELPQAACDIWYEIGFEQHESTLAVSVDGQIVATCEYPYPRIGRIGLATDSVAFFDNVEVRFR